MKILSTLYVLISCFTHIGNCSEKVNETWKDTNDGFKFKIKDSRQTKMSTILFNKLINQRQQTVVKLVKISFHA